MGKYETVAGIPSRGETFARIIDLVDQLIDQCSMMAHLHNTESNDADKLFARGWLGMVEIMQRLRKQFTQLAARRMQ